MIKYSCFILSLHLFVTCTVNAMDDDPIGNLKELPNEVSEVLALHMLNYKPFDEVVEYYASSESIKTLSGHEDSVCCIAVAGDCIVSGSDDTTIKVWDLETGSCIKTLTGHESRLNCITIAGDCIVSGSADKTIKIWNLETGSCIKTLTGHKDSVRCIAVAGDCIVSGSYDTTIKIWNLETGSCIKTLSGHEDRVHCIAVAGDCIVSGSDDTTIKIWYAPWLKKFSACTAQDLIALSQNMHNQAGHTKFNSCTSYPCAII